MSKSQDFFDNASEEEIIRLNVLSSQIQFLIAESFKQRDPGSELAQRAVGLHKEWIELVYGQYSSQLHRDLASKYTREDESLKNQGEFFKKAIFIFTKNKMD